MEFLEYNPSGNLLEIDQFQAKWSGARTQHGTTPFVDDMHNELMKMLDEFEIIISRWPVYTSDLENVSAIYLLSLNFFSYVFFNAWFLL